MSRKIISLSCTLALGLAAASSYGADFNPGIGDLSVTWVTNVTAAVGFRTKSPSCSLTGDPNFVGGGTACGAAADTLLYANGDDGDLNYRKNSFYTANLNLVTELLLKAPEEGLKFLARGQGIYDFAAQQTDRTPLSRFARDQSVENFTLLDLFLEKDFVVGSQTGHVRVGNQVINWGESYYAFGGINATNAIDMQKLYTPGTLLKQILLPAPILEVQFSLPANMSFDGYVQSHWYKNRYPPVGTFWSFNDVYGRGADVGTFSTTNFNFGGPDAGSIAGLLSHNRGAFNAASAGLLNGDYAGDPYYSLGIPYYEDDKHRTAPEFGLRLNYKPSWMNADLSLYYLNYTDKSPVLSYADLASAATWHYLENRQLWGVSANFPIGDWAVGSELSYRPHDAVAMSLCYLAGGPADSNTNLAGGTCNAYRDFKKLQLDVNGQYIMTRSSTPWLVGLVHATQAVLTLEYTWIRYPGVDRNKQYTSTVNGQTVYQVPDAEYVTWPDYSNRSGLGYPTIAGQGTRDSMGATEDFNVTYDGNFIPGWAVTPGVTLFEAFKGYTPNFQANYEVGYKSANFYMLFAKNPSTWNAGINYTMFFGGNALTQPFADRNNIGMFVTRNF